MLPVSDADSVLVAQPDVVKEGYSMTLTCTFSQNTPSVVYWDRTYPSFYRFAVEQYQDGPGCSVVAGTVVQGGNVSCPDARTYVLILSSLTRYDNGDMWRCNGSYNTFSNHSNAVTVQVLGKYILSNETILFWLTDWA